MVWDAMDLSISYALIVKRSLTCELLEETFSDELVALHC